MDILKQLPDKCIDLVLTDPPYGIGMDGGNVGYKGFNNFVKKDWDNSIPQKEIFNEIFRVSKNQIIWGGNYFGFKSRCFLIWDKGEGFYNRSYAEAELAYTSFDKNTCIFKYDPLAKRDYIGKLHPTQKPLKLFEWCLQKYSKENDLILDCFSGSSTTAVACHNLKRRFICIEKDEDYYKASVERLENAKAQLKLF
jgi:site-specific DNA-methyltransferase (adenine-specific)